MKHRTAFFLVSSLLLLFPCKGSSMNGYRALISCGDGFLAAGSGGRMEWISSKGLVIKSLQVSLFGLNALLFNHQSMVVAGDSGTLLISSDQKSFRQVDVHSNSTVFSLVQFNNLILAGSEQGLLLVGGEKDRFELLQLALEGNIVSLSANETDCFGVTDRGEIIHSTDGKQWKIFYFNTYYSGYYKPCRFTSVLVNEHQLFVAGKHDDGTPALYISAEGTIWTERALTYTNDQNAYCNLEEVPASISYDALEEQLLLVCSKGKIMKVPSCSHCNQVLNVTNENLTVLTQNAGNWLVVGEDFHIHALEDGWK